MEYAHFQTRAPYTLDQLKVAAGIGSRDDVGPGGRNICHFLVQDRTGSVRLQQVVNACTPAAPIGLAQLHQLEAGDPAQKVPRLGDDLLDVAKMAGV